MSKDYVVMLGTSYLCDYEVYQPVGTSEPEFLASVREKGITPMFFKDKDKANLVAKRLGGVVVVASWKGDGNDD
ncbi:hypothetical protein [Limosilactobacillus oris]|uniref:hypothetical protein n=1 Tax=Limosilactobacillus oris TaxID=1632 RepID=UPI0018841D3A|nr:hypothetical protein [Limosilactobacillus oris]MBF0600846.1 hypothetical protein [Limosilactobacillus oris]